MESRWSVHIPESRTGEGGIEVKKKVVVNNEALFLFATNGDNVWVRAGSQ